jgi:hypothetical protein
MENLNIGANIDDRSAAEKIKDIKFGEIVASASPVTWIEKPKASWRKFTVFNQNGSGSCVAQTIRKLAGILYWLKYNVFVNFSATDIYQRRSNKPAAGMNGVEAFNLWRDGITLNELAQSDELTDAEMDEMKIPDQAREAGKAFRLGNFVILPAGNIDTIASTIQTTGKPVMIFTFWDLDEWTPVPQIKNATLKLEQAPGRHSTAAVDFTLYDGEKALIIEESWGQTSTFDGQRILKESFFKTRNWFAAYPINFKFDEGKAADAPIYTFKKNLYFIAWDDAKNAPMSASKNESQKADVTALQDILKYEGLFPSNVSSTGYYGALTAKAVLAFQKKYEVATDAELDELAGRSVGPKTVAKLNQLYS